jgi:DNA repair protein RadC
LLQNYHLKIDVKINCMENLDKLSSSIKNWAIGDRPREKLIEKGANALSDSELLAILINNGNKKKSAVEIAKEMLKMGNDNLNELGKLTLKEFQKIKGIGMAKSVTVAAALELGRRRHAAVALKKTVIKNSGDIVKFLQTTIKDFNYEVFAVVFLNQSNKINHFEIISKGGITGTVADPRVILKMALEQNATSIILSHNHPSGSLIPSGADVAITNKIKEAAKYLDIAVRDHIIVSEEGYYSFAEHGEM